MKTLAAVFFVLVVSCSNPTPVAREQPLGSSEALVEFRRQAEETATAAGAPSVDPVKLWFLRTQIKAQNNPELWKLIGPKVTGGK